MTEEMSWEHREDKMIFKRHPCKPVNDDLVPEKCVKENYIHTPLLAKNLKLGNYREIPPGARHVVCDDDEEIPEDFCKFHEDGINPFSDLSGHLRRDLLN